MQARFSIAGMMVAVLLLAVGFAGLRTASALWASAIFTFTITLLTAALLGVAATRRRSRMACLGFSLFGWVYLLTTFWLWPGPNGVSAPPFLTKALLDAVQPPPQTPTAMTRDPRPGGRDEHRSAADGVNDHPSWAHGTSSLRRAGGQSAPLSADWPHTRGNRLRPSG